MSMKCEKVAPNIHETILRLLNAEKRKGMLIDVGAGNGELSSKIQKLGFQVKACDLYPENFEAEGIECKRVDLNKGLECYKSNSFDFIVASEVIEHLENPWLFVREVHRVLKSGGKFIITTPNPQSFVSRLKFLLTGKLPWFLSCDYESSRHKTPIFDFAFKRIIEGLFVVERWTFNRPEIMPILPRLGIRISFPFKSKIFGEVNIILLRKLSQEPLPKGRGLPRGLR